MLDQRFFERIATTPHKDSVIESYKAVYARSTMVLYSRKTRTPLAALTLKADDVGCLSMLTGRPSPPSSSEPYVQGMLNMPDQTFDFTISNLSDKGMINFNILHTPSRVSAVNPGPSYGINEVNELHPNESYTIPADQRNNCKMVLKGKTKKEGNAQVPVTVKESETHDKPTGLYFYLSVIADVACQSLVDKFAEGTMWKVTPGFVRCVESQRQIVYPDLIRGGGSMPDAYVSDDSFDDDILLDSLPPLESLPPLHDSPDAYTSGSNDDDVQEDRAVGAFRWSERLSLNLAASRSPPAMRSRSPPAMRATSSRRFSSNRVRGVPRPFLSPDLQRGSTRRADCYYCSLEPTDGTLSRSPMIQLNLVDVPSRGVHRGAAQADAFDSNLHIESAATRPSAPSGDGGSLFGRKKTKNDPEITGFVAPVDVGSTQAAELTYGRHVEVFSQETGHDYAYEHCSEPTVLCMSIWTEMKFLPLVAVEEELEAEVKEWVENEGKSLIESLNAIYKAETCVIDLESEADTIVCCCGHQCLNHANVANLQRCPLCRSPITAFVRADGIVVD